MSRRSQRDEVRARFGFFCGYCGVSENEAGAELTLDHFEPRSQGGSDETDNLVYACHACNEFKGDFWPNQPPWLHPQRDNFTLHLGANEDGTLQGLTPEGEQWITRLRLNRAPLVERRLEAMNRRRAADERAQLLEQLTSLEREVQRLSDELNDPE